MSATYSLYWKESGQELRSNYRYKTLKSAIKATRTFSKNVSRAWIERVETKIVKRIKG